MTSSKRVVFILSILLMTISYGVARKESTEAITTSVFESVKQQAMESVIQSTTNTATDSIAKETTTESVTYSVTDTSTESVTEPLPVGSIFTTCDFDLENIESLLKYLPAICSDIFYSRTKHPTLYDFYLEESKSFAKFYKKLNNYELRKQPNNGMEELTEYPFETKVRNDTYTKVNWSQCNVMANSSVTDYLSCRKLKHLEMMDLIPDVVGK